MPSVPGETVTRLCWAIFANMPKFQKSEAHIPPMLFGSCAGSGINRTLPPEASAWRAAASNTRLTTILPGAVSTFSG